MKAQSGIPMEIDIVGSSTFGIYNNISIAKTYNMYISDGYLVNYIGWKRILDLSNPNTSFNQGRGFFKSVRGNIAIAVINSSVYKINSVGGYFFIGDIETGSGFVSMDENLNGQICIADGLNAYIYNRFTNALTKQDFSGAFVPNYVCYHNTYFLFGNADISNNGSRWFACSYLNDNEIEITYTLALQTKPDFAKAVIRIPGKSNNVIVLGSTVGEIHTNIGGLQGYQRLSSLSLDFGILSLGTLASNDKYIGYLGINEKSTPRILIFDGENVNAVSTDGISSFLTNIRKPQESFGFFYETNNHVFYQITFYNDSDNVSLIYDITTNKFFHVSDFGNTYHPAREIIYFDNRSFFLSWKNANIYECGTNFYTYDENILPKSSSNHLFEYDKVIQRCRVSSNFDLPENEAYRGRRFTIEAMQGNDQDYPELEALYPNGEAIFTEDGEPVFTETGQRIYTEPSSELSAGSYRPVIYFSFSWDSGDTFTMEVPRVINYMAKSRNVIEWLRLGMFNVFTAKITYWSRGSVAIGKAVLEVSK